MKSALGALFFGVIGGPVLAVMRGYSLATLPVGFYFAVLVLSGIGIYSASTRQRFLKSHPVSS